MADEGTADSPAAVADWQQDAVATVASRCSTSLGTTEDSSGAEPEALALDVRSLRQEVAALTSRLDAAQPDLALAAEAKSWQLKAAELEHSLAGHWQELGDLRRSLEEQAPPQGTSKCDLAARIELLEGDLQSLAADRARAWDEDLKSLRQGLEAERQAREAQEVMVQESIKRHLVYEKVARELRYSSFEDFVEQRFADERASLQERGTLAQEHLEKLEEAQARGARLETRLGTVEAALSGAASKLERELDAAQERLALLEAGAPEPAPTQGSGDATRREAEEPRSGPPTWGPGAAGPPGAADSAAPVGSRAAGSEQGVSLTERLDYLEGLLGSSADRHDRELQDLKTVHAKHGKRLELLDSLQAQQADVAERLGGVEELVGGSLRGWAEERGAARARLEEFAGRLAACEADDLPSRLAACEARAAAFAELEKVQATHTREQAALGAQQAPLRERLERLEAAAAEAGARSAEALGAAEAGLEQVRGRISACEACGSELQELRGQQAALAADVSSTRADQDLVKDRLGQLEEKLAALGPGPEAPAACACVAADATARLEGLEQAVGALRERREGEPEVRELAQAVKEAQARQLAMEERLGGAERLLGDAAEKHRKEFGAASAGLEEVKGRLTAYEKEADKAKAAGALQRSPVKARIDCLEAMISSSPEKQGHRGGLPINESHATLKERVDHLQVLIGASGAQHAGELEALKAAHAMHGIELKAIKAAHASHFAVAECIGRVDKHSQELEEGRAKLEQFQRRLAACEGRAGAAAEPGAAGPPEGQQPGGLQERMENLESALCTSAEKHAAEMEALKAAHARHAKLLESMRTAQAQQASRAERLSLAERAIDDAADRYAKGQAATNATLDQLHSNLSALQSQDSPVRSPARCRVAIRGERAAGSPRAAWC